MAEDGRRTKSRSPFTETDSFRSMVAVGVSTLGALPLFVPAALSQRLRADLGVTAGDLGLMFSLYFLISGLCSWPAGRFVERVGASMGMRLGLLIATVSLAGSAGAPSAGWLAGSIAVAGLGQAIAQPAANLYLVKGVAVHLLGTAFGLKQSAVPMATLIAGLAVPVAAHLLGWRTLLLIAAGATCSLAIAWSRRAGVRFAKRSSWGTGTKGRRMSPRALVLVALTGGFGGASATALATFFVDSAVAADVSEPAAGVMLAVASSFGVLARISLGVFADRRPQVDRMRVVGSLLALGLVGFAMLAVGGPAWSLIGVVAGYVLGWSWPGLLHLVVATHDQVSPARATGGLQVGIALGSGVGPLLFGQLVEFASYAWAWTAAGLAALIAAGAALLSVRQLHGPH